MALPTTNTNDLVNRVDNAAGIFDQYGVFIRAIIANQTKDKTQADDLYQDFFLSLVAKPIPPDIQNIKTYIYRAITNDVIDAARRVKRYKTKVSRYSEHLNYFINKNCPEDALINEEQINKMFELIKGRLSRREAQAVLLRYKNGYNTKEVAQKMNVSKRSVSRYICIGISKIRHFFASNRGDLE